MHRGLKFERGNGFFTDFVVGTMSRRRQWPLVSLVVAALSAGPLAAQPTTEIENVVAFARLYGVARWFHPSDAAATLDWNRFAVAGVQRVRGAPTPAVLEATLRQLFAPLGPGFEIGATLTPGRQGGAQDRELIAWHYRGAGISEGAQGPYSAKRINRSSGAANTPPSSPVILSQMIAADSVRGRAVRLRGLARVTDPAAQGWAGFWLRVDRPGQTVGFFDNMQDRPIRDSTWREYVIEGTIASDATQIVFGALSVGAMGVDVDAIELDVRAADGAWTRLAIRDPGFEEALLAGARGWSVNQPSAFTRSPAGAPRGARFLRLTSPAAGRSASPLALRPTDSVEIPVAGATSEFVLSRGLRARVPLSLTDAEARAVSPDLVELRAALAAVAAPRGRHDTDARLADIVVAWNVFRHFYPYWGDLAVDWDARLRPQLALAHAAADTRAAHVDAVRTLVADLQDGHGSVSDGVTPPRLASLPVAFRILAERLIVTASRDTAVPVGSVVTAMNGAPAADLLRHEVQLASGTPQWKRTRAENAMQRCRLDSSVTLTIDPPVGPAKSVTLPCTRTTVRPVEARPDSIAELEPGLWYVDLTRILAAQLRPLLATLATARGIVFDLRGYPTDAGAAVLPHLMREREAATDRWMHVPRYARPFAEVAEWQHLTWSLQPATPQLRGARVFLTDGRAISYAESVMGYVRDYQLGTIIGGPTAGANGNVAAFSTPSGLSVVFTGMRVTRHDGRTPFHTRGVSPDVALEPTVEGIRAGRDELLARALVTLRGQR